MLKTNYLDNLLKLCTPEQLGIYSKIYPNGPTKQQLPRAIQQVERTLSTLNYDVQQLRNAKTELELFKLDALDEIKALNTKLTQAEMKITSLETDNERLRSSVDINILNVQERLDKLNRLEAAGVDNWEGYDYAMRDD